MRVFLCTKNTHQKELMANHNTPPWVLIFVALIGATGVVLAAVLSRPQRDSTPNPIVNGIAIAAPTISTSMPQQACIVPQLERLDQVAAEIAISQLGLRTVKSAQYNAEVASGLVLSQDPPVGKKLEPCEGDIVIVVSLGPLPTLVPPTETSLPPTPILPTIPPNVPPTVSSTAKPMQSIAFLSWTMRARMPTARAGLGATVPLG
jgi:hypothetical protein